VVRPCETVIGGFMKLFSVVTGIALITSSMAFGEVTAIQTPYDQADSREAIVLKNDSFKDSGGQAYLQLGFVEGEKAGVHVQVPAHVERFKVDYFRVLMGSTTDDNSLTNTNVYFHMGIVKKAQPSIGAQIENAASVTPGPYWNDIPAQGSNGQLGCAAGGDYIAAALEFTHGGAPSVYRDLDGQSNMTFNSIYAIPGGWKYSIQLGVRGDWVLRVVGHEATADEC
jgi:hypothetical protein